MHICFITGEYPPSQHGGVGVFVQTIARALVSRGHFVTVIGLYSIEERVNDYDQGVLIIRVPVMTAHYSLVNIAMNHYQLWKEIRRVNSEQSIDIVEGPELTFGLLPFLPDLIKLIRMQGGHHFFSRELGNKVLLGRALVERLSFMRADAYCAITEYIAHKTQGYLNVSGSSIEILPNPVDINAFYVADESEVIDNLIVFVGTVTAKKGVFELIEAMQEVVEHIPDAKLRLIGRDRSNTSTLLQEKIPDNLRDKIVFYGAIEHETLPDVLASAQVCVFPSHTEGQGIVIIEGMAMGKPVIASKTGPGPEIIDDGVNGLLCDPYDPSSIAEQLIKALKDKTLRKRLGIAAREKVENTFALDLLVDKNEAFYQHLIEKHRQ